MMTFAQRVERAPKLGVGISGEFDIAAKGIDQTGIKFDFNFHSTPTTHDQAKEALRDKILVHKSKALDLLRSIYSLTPEV